MESVLISKEKRVQFNGQEVVLKRMNLRQFKLVADHVEDLKKNVDLDALDNGSTTEIMKAVADLLRTVPDKAAQILHMVTGVDVERIMEADMDEVMTLALHAWQHNNLKTVWGEVQKKVNSPQA